MSNLVRLSFSIEKPLVDQLERLVKKNHYVNRSEFIRDMIRAKLVNQEWEANEEAIGTITLLYDYHTRLLNEKLIELQHDFVGKVLASTHVNLDSTLCSEMIMVKGRAKRINELCDSLQQLKGVLHAALSMTSTGKKLV
jgi:CopG family nickel-responsive transcriptional regulator